MGEPFALRDLAEVNQLEVVLYRDDQQIDRGEARNAAGDQLEALLWLVNHLQVAGWPLEPGHVLITGALGKINPGVAGRYRAVYSPEVVLDFQIAGPPEQSAGE